MNETTNCGICKVRSECFNKLDAAELEFISAKKKQIAYAKGENVCKQGAYASYVLYIADGLVKVYVEHVGRKYNTVKILTSGEFIGFSSIFGENIYNYSAIALKDSTICLIEKSGIKKLLSENASFGSEIIKQYCSNESHLFGIIKSLGYKQLPGRLADALIYLSSEKFANEEIYKYISRTDIADFACASVESTVKLLKIFETDGIIKLEGKDIKILDDQRLKEISRVG